MPGPEAKLWSYVKKNFKNISWTRIENTTSFGTPDLLGYNKNNIFFTLELKVTTNDKVRFSPHQIAFHVKHPNNSFILVQGLAPRCLKLYEGSKIQELAACGLMLAARSLALEACTRKRRGLLSGTRDNDSLKL